MTLLLSAKGSHFSCRLLREIHRLSFAKLKCQFQVQNRYSLKFFVLLSIEGFQCAGMGKSKKVIIEIYPASILA